MLVGGREGGCCYVSVDCEGGIGFDEVLNVEGRIDTLDVDIAMFSPSGLIN
jgi:hypothetical protein